MSEAQVRPGGPVRTVATGDVDEELFLERLRETIDVLEAADIPHVLMGGLAVAALARPRWTHDIDVFVRPDDAQRALDALEQAGYEPERTDPMWLFKARKDDTVVDIIFRSTGHIYFDEEIGARAVETTFRGERVRVVPPEDLIVIKVSAHNEEGGYHWFDALALLTRPGLDWDYLIARARRAPRRILSLLIYAESSDIAVPRWVIEELLQMIDLSGREPGETRERSVPAAASSRSETPIRDAGAEHVRRLLLDDPRVGDLDVQVSVHGDTVLLTGEVMTDERREQLSEAAASVAPERRIDNRTTVRQVTETTDVEEIA